MTVVRDSFLERAGFGAATPATWAFTPVGTPRSITVFIAHGDESTDLITGAVTYGGVALTRVATNGFARDTAGEPGAAYAYHLGASIPTGTQTVSIAHSGSATAKWAIVVAHTAAADTGIVVSGKLEGDQANPQLALDSGAASAIRACILYSGHDALASIAVLSGMDAMTTTADIDFGTFTAFMGQQTTASTGSFTIGFTATSEDVAFIAIAIGEVAGDQTLTGTLFTSTATWPTGILSQGVPVAPSSLTATGTGTTTVDVAWTDNSTDETSFRIERSPNGTTGWVTAGTNSAGDVTFTDTGRTCGTTYFYRVFAVNALGDSTASNTDDGTTTACPPPTPSTGGNRMGGSGAVRKPPRHVGR